MMRKVKFSDLVSVYRSIDFEGGGRGVLNVSTQELVDTLDVVMADENSDDSGIVALNGDNEFSVGQKLLVEVGPPRTGLGVFSVSFDEYLSFPEARILEKNNYYISDLSFCSKDVDVPEILLNYRSVLGLVGLLEGVAHYLDHRKEEVVFFNSGRYVIPIKYDSATVSLLDCSVVSRLLEFSGTEPHKDQKMSILAETVIKLTEEVSVDERFKFLVLNAGELLERLTAGYSLFASDFTYEKVRDELESLKIDLTTKIHKAISDIQSQILSIPVATVLAVSQMKRSELLDVQFVYNTALLLGVIIFCVLMFGFIINQKLTLGTIEGEVKRLYHKYDEKMKDCRSVHKDIFKNLCARITLQYFALYCVLSLLVVALIVSVVFYFVLTVQARA